MLFDHDVVLYLLAAFTAGVSLGIQIARRVLR
jgi:hypothetical protein